MHCCSILQFAAAGDDQNMKDVRFCKDGGVALCSKNPRYTLLFLSDRRSVILNLCETAYNGREDSALRLYVL